MSEGAYDMFALVTNFWEMIGNQNMSILDYMII
jgi:hypothetical protein